MPTPLTEPEFRLAADAALEALEKRLLPLCDEHDVELERQNGVLQLGFEEPTTAKFIVSPNAPVRQVWVSARGRSFKLSWSESAGTFVLEGEALVDLLTRLTLEQLAAS